MPVPDGVTFRSRALPMEGWDVTRHLVERRHPAIPDGWSVREQYDLTIRMTGNQVTESEGHPWASRKRGSIQDVGGDFFTQKRYVAEPVRKYRLDVTWQPRSTDILRVKGDLIAANSLPLGLFDITDGLSANRFATLKADSWPPASISSDDDLDEYGATAIARCKPTNSVADLSVAIGELAKDGLPKIAGSSLWKERLSGAKAAPRSSSQEFLNYQFGIKPLLNDIKEFANGIRKMDDIITQFEKDAGKNVRRKYYFPLERSVSVDKIMDRGGESFYNSYGPNNPIETVGTCTRRREIVTRRWFSGSFTYMLPIGMNSRSVLGEIRLKADRLGLDPDLDTAWNVAPWSWAVDWFSNTGDVISNVNDFQKYGLILRYGYIMEHVRVSDTYSWEGSVLKDGRPLQLPSTTLITETKRRRKANPFGFGVKWDGLSSTQAAILAALGITRGSR